MRESLLEQTGLALGDSVRLPAVEGVIEVTIVGVLPRRPVFGDEELYLPLATAQVLFGLPGQINALTGQFVDGEDAEALRAAILADLGPGYSAGSVEAGGTEWDAVLRIGEVAFLLFGGLALAMGGFSILNTFRTGVAERRRDIGMLRAIGTSRRAVTLMVVAESLLIGLAGTALVSSRATPWSSRCCSPSAPPGRATSAHPSGRQASARRHGWSASAWALAFRC